VADRDLGRSGRQPDVEGDVLAHGASLTDQPSMGLAKETKAALVVARAT
jgi:hypothetical protein